MISFLPTDSATPSRPYPVRAMPLLAIAYDPAWTLPGVAAALVGLLLAIRGFVLHDRLRKAPHCPKCRYDLGAHTGAAAPFRLPVTCPECGREVDTPKQLFRPRRRKRITALGVFIFLAGTASILHPEVRAKGGWVFNAKATAFLIALPHLDEPKEWSVYDPLRTRLNRAFPRPVRAQYRSKESRSLFWGWMQSLLVRRVAAGVGDGETELCREASILLLSSFPWQFNEDSSRARRAILRALLDAMEQEPRTVSHTAANVWRMYQYWKDVSDSDPELADRYAAILTDWLNGSDGLTADLGFELLVLSMLIDERHIPALRQRLRRREGLDFTFFAVSQLGPRAGGLGEDLLAIARDRHSAFRWEALAVLVRLADNAPEATDEFVEYLLSARDWYEPSQRALSVICSAGPEGMRYGPVVIQLIRSGKLDAQTSMWSFAKGWGANQQPSVPNATEGALLTLTAVLEEGDTARSRAIRHALRDAPDESRWLLSMIEEAAASDSSLPTRTAAASAARAIRNALSEPHP